MKRILGYSDKLSVQPRDSLAFMVSSEGAEEYQASVVRLIHGDANPAGPGYKEVHVEAPINGRYRGRKQETVAGSYIVVPHGGKVDSIESFTAQVLMWPTTPEKGRQSLLSWWDERTQRGFVLGLDAHGSLCLRLGDGAGAVAEVTTGKPLLARQWYLAAGSYAYDSGEVRLYQQPLAEEAASTAAEVTERVSVRRGSPNSPLIIAAHDLKLSQHIVPGDAYNGKLERPVLTSAVLGRLEIEQAFSGTLPDRLKPVVLASWDFAQGITTETVFDTSPNRLHGETVNLPARAMKGHNWSSLEMCWRHAPELYGAIHFHDDDLYDAGWEVDFTLRVPDELRSGIYAVRIQAGEHEDHIPFIVRPPRGTTTADLAFLVPTASYMAYANDHMAVDFPVTQLAIGRTIVLGPHDLILQEHREYGLSCYDVHSDGSGVCYSSRLRPILDMRPKIQGALGGAGSSLWQFNADLHITDWLEARNYAYDCITDEDLHYEGASVLAGYRVVLTGTHPEYWSKQMWDALDAYKKAGGRLMYLGGNGWYWRIAFHQSKPGVIEVRRAEDGIRSWAAEPGEYYHSFTGEYGGLWRRQGLPPQLVAGTGFTAQGFDISSYYRRKPDSFDPRARFIFEGIGDDELIGDFGLIGGGAAGLELDRADPLLGTPKNALVLASSENHTDIYYVVCEDMLTNRPGLSGQESPLVRADMVFYETPSGGAVFSASSIAWAGSLSHNSYNNNVSLITTNVLNRFLEKKPFCRE